MAGPGIQKNAVRSNKEEMGQYFKREADTNMFCDAIREKT
jgi:hypothetical protein